MESEPVRDLVGGMELTLSLSLSLSLTLTLTQVRDLVGGMERGEVCPVGVRVRVRVRLSRARTLTPGQVCPDALSPQELSACLLREGRLLRTVTDATCQSLRLGKTECEG